MKTFITFLCSRSSTGIAMTCGLLLSFAGEASALAQGSAENDWPQLYQTDFSSGVDEWRMLDPESWRIEGEKEQSVLSLFRKQSDYQPPHRSPLHIALLKQPRVGSFDLRLRVLSTHEDYNHRDVCLFFGYQGPDKFYYVHFGKQTDPHANQIFIVNQAARTKISLTTTDGTPWDEQWHDVRLLRNVETGDISVFFDDMDNPVMTANDRSFLSGQIGLGSFDDTAQFDDLVLKGVKK